MSQAPPPPPPPPPPPTAPPAAKQSGWRKLKGQDYWERALNSFHSLIQPLAPTPTPPPTSPTSQPAPQLTRNISTNNTVCTDMDTSTNVKLSTAYYQTRNTRQAHNTTTVHNIELLGQSADNQRFCLTAKLGGSYWASLISGEVAIFYCALT